MTYGYSQMVVTTKFTPEGIPTEEEHEAKILK